jgi:hypothetical protein
VPTAAAVLIGSEVVRSRAEVRSYASSGFNGGIIFLMIEGSLFTTSFFFYIFIFIFILILIFE